MFINRSLLFVAALALISATACLKKHLGAADGSTEDVDAGVDAAPPDRGDDAYPDAAVDLHIAPPTSVAITSPTATTTYTNSSVNFKLSVTGATPSTSVDLVLPDDTVLASITAPFHFTWDTTSESEGTYKVAARTTMGGQTLTSSSVAIVVDRTPPSVASQTPMPGANNVGLPDPVSITFSEPLAPNSVTAGAIALSAGAIPLAATSSLTTEGTTITVALTVPPALSLPTNISATVQTSLTDRAGNPIAAPADWSWVLPLWVDLGSFPGGFPSLALDPEDHPFLSTTEQVPGSFAYTLHVGRLGADKTWLELLSPSAATVDSSSSLAIDTTGAPLVAWSQGHVHLARWLGGTTTPWDLSYGTVDDLPTFSARFPSLAIDSSNVPTIAWAYPNGHTDLDYAARWNPNTLSWQHLFADPNVPIAPGTPSLRLDATGLPLIIAFYATSVASVNRFASATWHQLDTASATTYAPDAIVSDLRADPANRPTIVVPSSSASKIRVTYFNGTAWQDLGPNITTGTGVADARLVFDTSSAVVLWTEAGQKLRLARLTQNAWNYMAGTISSVSGGTATIASPTLAIDSKGHAVVAWSETTNGQLLTFVRRSNR